MTNVLHDIEYLCDSSSPKDKMPFSFDPHHWIEIQDSLKESVISEDDFTWIMSDDEIGNLESSEKKLQYIGGVDLSFSDQDPSMACAAVVIMDLGTLCVVHEMFIMTNTPIPYVPGFLSFREGPVIVDLLQKLKHDIPNFYPQILMVDGNGLLHSRGFGLASYVGVVANLPTIGIGKNFYNVDGLTLSKVRRLVEANPEGILEGITLTGDSGTIWGAALRTTRGSSKPIFVSIGHRLSLETAIKVVKKCCKYRIPEPIRQADIRSRSYLQNKTRTAKPD